MKQPRPCPVDIITDMSVCELVSGNSEVPRHYGMLDQFTKVSKKRCIELCNEDIKCVRSSYNHMLKLCKIFEFYETLVDTESTEFIYLKSTELLENDKNTLADCRTNSISGTTSDACTARHCGEPKVQVDTEILGNMYRVGSKIRYNCVDGTDLKISTCEPSGQWSDVSISCRCSKPQVSSSVGFTLQKFNETHIQGKLSCSEGLGLLFYNQVFCQISNGQWTGIHEENACVNITTWFKIYDYSGGCDVFIVKGWKKDNINPCVYRHSKVDHWYNISQVKFDVVINNTSVAFIILNGTGSNNYSWFSHERVIESSWPGLTSSSTVGIFSITGVNTFNRRWFVAESYSSDKSGLCDDKVWVTVTWSGDQFNCISNMPSTAVETVILYSNASPVSSMRDMLLADSIRVSIKVKE
ncbi:hypothetical protein ACF0H5_005857 [Mactra antiquata]